MGDNTGIQWTDATWNPVVGCTKVSEGCRNCYIERTPPFRVAGMRFAGPFGPGEPGATTGVLLHHDRLTQPLRWQRPRRVFVNSLSDLYHPQVRTSFIAGTFAVMALAHRHTFQVLTKRPTRMAALLNSSAFLEEVAIQATTLLSSIPGRDRRISTEGWTKVGELWRPPWPLPNLWNGASVEDQRVTWRIPKLLATPSAVRFLSCEPLLGPVSLIGDDRGWLRPGGIDWIIAGGESGPLRYNDDSEVVCPRPMHPAWLRLLIDQAAAHQVAMFVKQFGGWRYVYEADDFAAEQTARAAGDLSFEAVTWRSLEVDGRFVEIPTDTSVTVSHYGGHNADPAGWPEWARVREFPRELMAA